MAVSIELGGAVMEFGEQVLNLSNLEVNKAVAANLKTLGHIQHKIKEIHERQVGY
jgi:hypothetical protein